MVNSFKEQFSYKTDESFESTDCHLTLRISSHFFCFCIYRPADNHLLQLKRYTFQVFESDLLLEIIESNSVLKERFDRIICGLNFGFNTLLPAEMSSGDVTPLMFLENSGQQDHVITEHILKGTIANLYAVPATVLSGLVRNFPSAEYIHSLSVTVNGINDFSPDGLLRVDICEKHFTVAGFLEEKLLIAKTYAFNQPSDIAFYLLKICEVFGLSQEKVLIKASGLFSSDSKIYRALYDYFLNLSIIKAAWVDNITNCPAHYFTSLNDLTICESFLEV